LVTARAGLTGGAGLAGSALVTACARLTAGAGLAGLVLVMARTGLTGGAGLGGLARLAVGPRLPVRRAVAAAAWIV
jgi:hypothetical protein